MSTEDQLSWVRNLIYGEDNPLILRIYRAMDHMRVLGNPTDPIAQNMLRDYMVKKGLPRWYVRGELNQTAYQGLDFNSFFDFKTLSQEEGFPEALDIANNVQQAYSENISLMELRKNKSYEGENVANEIRFTFIGLPFVSNPDSQVRMSILPHGMRIDVRPFGKIRPSKRFLNYSHSRKVIWASNHIGLNRYTYEKLRTYTEGLDGMAKLIGDTTYFDHFKDDRGLIRKSELWPEG